MPSMAARAEDGGMALGMAEKVGMTSVMAEDEEGETSSESSSEPDEDLLKTEDEEEMEDEETDEEAAAAAEAKKEAAAARWNDGLADQLGNGGVILVLFEMPSGFAVFRYDGIKLLLPDARQNIWADFVHDFTAKHVIHLLDIGTFEDKGRAINEDTGVSEALGKMILGCHKPGQKIAVGNMVYKRIIESNMDIVCLCCPAVDELMWGLKISLRNFVPTERSGLTNEDRLPMSQGMRSFLNMHNFDIEPDMMVTKEFVQLAGHLNKCDQRVNKYKYFLLDASVHIQEISRIDTKDWDLLKLATALMVICCPEKIIEAPRLLFPAKQLKILKEHAPLYENKILKTPLLVAYDKMYWARKIRCMVARQLLRLIKRHKRHVKLK